ncbi:WD40-repeat-containing domain protein [Amylocystis lapponica]|nr:WD40-repeat-containing domain protein [Amylocystis lapponica]
MEPVESVWTPPQYDISRLPKASSSTLLSPNEGHTDFFRSAKWSPDGSVALAQCENRSFRYLDLPRELLDSTLMFPTPESPTAAPIRKIFHQQGSILDFVWFPSATVRDPASFCFVASVRDCPVKLLDANDGRLRASYKIVDHRERQIAPHSLAFNATSDKLYCGFEDAIEVFDVQSPGEGTRLHTTPSKKSRDGLKGIISALAFSADVNSGIYAAGSLSPSAPTSSNIGLFTETTGEAPVMFVGAENALGQGGFGVRASVVQLMFNPIRPYLLYASFRRHDTFYSWDLRGDVSVPVKMFHISESGGCTPATNQKLRFDVDISGNVLGVGDHSGNISLFDLTAEDSQENAIDQGEGTVPHATPTLTYKAHNDAVGSVAFHPFAPSLLSVSGSRHFDAGRPCAAATVQDSDTSDSEDDHEADDDSGAEQSERPRKVYREHRQPHTSDASAKLWSFGMQGESH